ncbi:MAG: rhomboid family intramembrane serine protease [Chloroflexota bacterium]
MLPLSDPDLITRRRPTINIVLISLCTLVFIYELTLVGISREVFFYKLGFIPVELTRGTTLHMVPTPSESIDVTSPIPDWMTLFTSMFIHEGWLHILGNMLYLWVFGDNIEDRLGHFKYLVFYLAAGLFAALLQTLANMNSDMPNIGASGAIAGVLGAYIVFFPYSHIRTMVIFFFITFIRIPALVLLGFWFFLQFASGVGSIGLADLDGVAYWAHIGGFVFGMSVAFICKIATRHKYREIHPVA